MTKGKFKTLLIKVINEFKHNDYEVKKIIGFSMHIQFHKTVRLFCLDAVKALKLPKYPQPITKPAKSKNIQIALKYHSYSLG